MDASGRLTAGEIASAITIFSALRPADRLELFGEMMQKQKDERYTRDDYQLVARFKTKDEVVLCREGLYYFAQISVVSEETCSDLKKFIPCYQVLYRGQKKVVSNEWVMEYDITGLKKEFEAQEHLLAHYFNIVKLREESVSAARKVGMFLLSETEMVSLEAAVEAATSMKVVPGTEGWTFKKWLGL